MVRAVRNARPAGASVGYAISAVDVALWDLKAELLGLPLHRLLGAVRDAVPVYGSGGFTTYNDRAAHRAARGTGSASSGIGRVKIKMGESWGADTGRDLDRMRAGPRGDRRDAELFVDANGGYTASRPSR